MAWPKAICLRRWKLRRSVDEDRVNSTTTRRLVPKRRREAKETVVLPGP